MTTNNIQMNQKFLTCSNDGGAKLFSVAPYDVFASFFNSMESDADLCRSVLVACSSSPYTSFWSGFIRLASIIHKGTSGKLVMVIATQIMKMNVIIVNTARICPPSATPNKNKILRFLS